MAKDPTLVAVVQFDKRYPARIGSAAIVNGDLRILIGSAIDLVIPAEGVEEFFGSVDALKWAFQLSRDTLGGDIKGVGYLQLVGSPAAFVKLK